MELSPLRGTTWFRQCNCLFSKLESLLCCTQFLNWRLCALRAQYPAVGVDFGLDWKELKVMALGFLAWHLSPHWNRQESDNTVRASGPAGCPHPRLGHSGDKELCQAGSHSVRPGKAHVLPSCVQNRQLCSSLASHAHPREVPVSFPSCSSSEIGRAHV